jgi:hypothetical protein
LEEIINGGGRAFAAFIRIELYVPQFVLSYDTPLCVESLDKSFAFSKVENEAKLKRAEHA